MNPVVRLAASARAPDVEAAARAPAPGRRVRARSFWAEEVARLDAVGDLGVCTVRAALHAAVVRYRGEPREDLAVGRLRQYLADRHHPPPLTSLSLP